MSSDKELASLAILALTPDDERDGRISRLQAEASMRTGPVLHVNVPSGRLAGPCACLVGRDAMDFACGAGLEMLSSSRGWAPLIGGRFGVAVINRDGPAHREDRRAWAPTFTPVAIEGMLGAIDDRVMRRIDAWVGAGTIDAYEASRELGFAAVATIVAGFRDDDSLSLLGRQFAQVFAPPEDGDPAAQHVRVQPLRDAIERALGAHIDAMQRDTPAKEAGLIARLARNEALSKDALLQHLNLLLVTGHETTATLLAWCLLLIAEDSPRRERLRNEASAIGRGVPKAAELAGLRELDAFIAETGRLRPPLVNAPRIATRDFSYGGVRVREGTTVALALGASQIVEARYADAGAFRPERFLRGDIGATSTFTFGRGARACIGMRFAQAVVKLALARLLSCAIPTRTPGERCTHAGFWGARPRGPLAVTIARQYV